MKAAHLAFALVALMGFALSGCASEKAKLNGAVMAQDVPIYPRAEYRSQMGGTTSEGLDGPAISKSMSWFFDVEDPMQDVVAYYEKEWAGSTRSEEDTEEGSDEVVFKASFAGATAEEYLAVRIGPKSLQITEVLSPSRFPSDE